MHEDIQSETFLRKFKPATRPAQCDERIETLLQREVKTPRDQDKAGAPVRFWALWSTLAACALAAVLWGMSDASWRNALDRTLAVETDAPENNLAAPAENAGRAVSNLEMYFWGSEEIQMDGCWIWTARLYATTDGGTHWQTIEIPKPHNTYANLADQSLTSIKCCYEDKNGDICFLGWLVTDTGKRRGRQKLDSVFYRLDEDSMKLEICGRSPEGRQLEQFDCGPSVIILADAENTQRHYSNDNGKTWSTQPTDEAIRWDDTSRIRLETLQAQQYELVLMEEELRRKYADMFEEFSKEWQTVERFSNGITLYRSQTSQTPVYRLGNTVTAHQPEVAWKGGEIKLSADTGERTLKAELAPTTNGEKDLNPGPKNRPRKPSSILALSFSTGEMEGIGPAVLLTSFDGGETWQSQNIADEEKKAPELYDTGLMLPGYVEQGEAALQSGWASVAVEAQNSWINSFDNRQRVEDTQARIAILGQQLAELRMDPDKNQDQIVELTAELERLRTELDKHSRSQR